MVEQDVALVGTHRCAALLPKAPEPDEVADAVSGLPESSQVNALLETAAGTTNAASICRVPSLIRAAFGHIDLSAELGIDPGDCSALGFTGKLCMHPAQVPLVNDVFEPTQHELDWARKVLDSSTNGRATVIEQSFTSTLVVHQCHSIVEVPDVDADISAGATVAQGRTRPRWPASRLPASSTQHPFACRAAGSRRSRFRRCEHGEHPITRLELR